MPKTPLPASAMKTQRGNQVGIMLYLPAEMIDYYTYRARDLYAQLWKYAEMQDGVQSKRAAGRGGRNWLLRFALYEFMERDALQRGLKIPKRHTKRASRFARIVAEMNAAQTAKEE